VPEPTPVDTRFVRFEQGAVAVVLLAGFVFRTDWVVPVTAAVLGVGVVDARANLLVRLWDALVRARLGPPEASTDAAEARFTTLFAVAVLAAATALLAVGLGGLAWLLAVLLAAAEAVGAVAAIPLAHLLYERLTRRRPGR
jgi:hypothetical protein